MCEEKSAEIGREEIAEAVNFVGSQRPPLSVANYTKKRTENKRRKAEKRNEMTRGTPLTAT